MLDKIILFALSLSLISPISSFITPHVIYIGPDLQGVKVGPLNPNSTLTVAVLIPPKNAQQLYLLAQEIGNKQINMTKAQLFEEMGNPEKAQEVANYLGSYGFRVQAVTPVEVIAYASAYNVERAFGVKLYLYNMSGLLYYAPSSTPKYVEALDGVAVIGLTNFSRVQPTYYHVVLGYFQDGKLVPALNGTGLHLSYLPLSLPQIAQAYNVTQGGKGINVAILDMYGDPTLQEDLNALDSKYGLPPANITVIPLGPYMPVLGILSGWAIETALDVETVHAMAPYAHIYLIAASSGDALLASIPYVVSALNVSVVSMSWGIPENLIAANGMYIYFEGIAYPNIPLLDYWFAVGSALGITFVASSGDGGAFSYTLTSYGGTSWPASSPFVLAAGGTSLYPALVNGSYGQPGSEVTYGYETAWSIMPYYFPLIGGGGGVSALEPKLPFQPGNYSSRLVPDVSADANPYTGAIVYAYGIEILIGGTSLAAPTWAGIIADLKSQLGKDFGLLNPILYEIYRNSTLYSMAFHQITFGFNGVYYAHEGYNLVTGLGSPNYYGLLKAINYTLSKPSLKISVTTFAEGYSLPWYNVNTTFRIVAYITYPNGTIVSNGSFEAYITTTEGIITEVPLKFNGTYWTAEYTILPIAPGGEWLVYINGTSGKLSGYGVTILDIGPSVAIVYPIPFPYYYYLPPNYPLTALVLAYEINGTPMNVTDLQGNLVMYGKVYENLTFVISSLRIPGLYAAQFAIITGMPQGVYLLFVNGTGYKVFTYVTVGLNLLAEGFTQVLGSEPVMSEGQKFVLFSLSYSTVTGTGLFTTNVTAYVYSPEGKLIEAVHLVPAPATTQFGVIYAFGLQEANITLNVTQPGWYKVVLVGLYNYSTNGVEVGNYTMWFYYSPLTVKASVKELGPLSTGESFLVNASITLPNGTPVTYGSFIANLVPNYLYSQAINFEASNAVPLNYNSTTKTWMGVVALPSQFNQTISGLSGNSYSLSGTWYLEIIGSSPYGSVMDYFPISVSPQAFLYTNVITPENLNLFTTNGVLYGVSSSGLTIEDVKGLVIENSHFGLLNLTNSDVVIINSEINTIFAVNSNVTVVNSLIHNSPVGIYEVNSEVSVYNTPFVNVTKPIHAVGGSVSVYPVQVQNYYLYIAIAIASIVIAVIALILAISRR